MKKEIKMPVLLPTIDAQGLRFPVMKPVIDALGLRSPVMKPVMKPVINALGLKFKKTHHPCTKMKQRHCRICNTL